MRTVPTADDPAGKNEWRRRLLTARAGVPAAVRAAEAAALAAHVGRIPWLPGATVCAYVPVGSEPGSERLLAALRAAGARVLLPVARTPGPLRWAEHTAELVAAPLGLREPAGAHLPPDALADADVVLVPALAVDRAGVRLGRGAGYYDRSLPLARPDARLVAVVRDDEVVDRLPGEPHDVVLGWALTPAGGLQRLGR